MSKIPFLNTHVDNLTMAETLARIEDMLALRKPSCVMPVNVDVIVKMEQDAELRQVVNTADLVLADGKPLIWISRLHHLPIREKISGSDLVPKLCERAAEKGYSVFILGGQEGVAEKAGTRLQERLPTLRVCGTYAPPLGFEKDEDELARIDRMIAEAKPDLLIVCLGCPKQEKWTAAHYQKCGATVSVCAGATVDFLAGHVRRAPKWMSDHGLEWLYRFLQEPGRLFKRYFVEDVKIMKLIKKYRGGVILPCETIAALRYGPRCAA